MGFSHPSGKGRVAVLAAAITVLGLTAAGCGKAATATTTNGTGVINAIGGKYVHVTSILNNPNTDPHTFEASPQIAQEVSTAQLIVQNGVGYDGFMSRIQAASPNPQRKVIVVQHVLGLPDATPNPHLWYDPRTMPAVARVMAADLAALQPTHKAYFQANLAKFNDSLKPWLSAIAQFKAAYPGTKAATTEPVADYLLTAMGITNVTPFTFQADIMHGTDPAPQDIALENGFFSKHEVKVFAYNQQVVSALTSSIRQNASKAGVPIVGVYETMPTGYDYQRWMLAEVNAIQKAVTSKISTQKL